jgi:hypothetical protein
MRALLLWGLVLVAGCGGDDGNATADRDLPTRRRVTRTPGDPKPS